MSEDAQWSVAGYWDCDNVIKVFKRSGSDRLVSMLFLRAFRPMVAPEHGRAYTEGWEERCDEEEEERSNVS